LSLRRNFLNNNLRISLSAVNLFKEWVSIQESVLHGHTINTTQNDNRYVSLSINYTIGNAYDYRSKSASETEKRRVK
jgi:hypothetical protein